MKHLFKIKIAFLMVFCINFKTNAQVKIGANSAPVTSAVLELESGTNKGFLGPKVALTSTTDVTTISSPATGLLVYNTATAGSAPNNVTPGYYYYSGTAWVSMSGATNLYNSNGTLSGTRTVTQGSNTLAFTSTATNGFSVDGSTFSVDAANNRVGIGTASPVNALDVVGDVNVKAGSLSIRTGLILTPTAGNSSTGYSPLVLQNYAGKNVFKIQQEVSSDSSIFFQTDAANNGASELTRMVIKRATGNIGIGTSTPSEKLTVVDNSGANYVMSLLESKSATTGPAGSGTTLLLQNNNSTTNNFSGINFRNSNGLPVASMIAINKNHSAATGTGQLSFWITNSGTSTEKMRIDENGYVGIGTSTPTVALDVVGGVRIKGGSGLTLTPTGGSSSSGYSPFFIQNNAGNNVFALQQEYGSDSTSMFFLTDALNNGATYNIRMVIKRATGYIGMGTSAPNSKLDVASNDDMVGRFESFSSDPTGVVTIVVPNSNTNCNTCSELAMFKKATGSIMGSISSNLSSSTVAYNTTSDIRLKENIKPSHFSINDLMKIQVADYTRISDSTKTVETGYLAQQLYSVFPSAVTPGGEDAKSKPWMVDYGRITPLIIKSVQDQQAEIEALKAELAQLKALINKIEAVK